MCLSSPQGTLQVSRLGWRIRAQSVTNAFGWSAGPRGALLHCSVETWQQSLQELFKWEKLYQSQSMPLRARPIPLNRTLKTRWSSLSLYLILLFMCFRSFSWVGQLRGLGNKTCQNICPSWLKGQKTVAVYTVFLSNNNMSRVKSWCRILYCFCCWKQRRGREYCILAVEWSRVGQPRRNFGVPVLITVQSTEAKSSFLVQKSCKSSLSLKPFIPFRGKFDDCVKVITSITVFKLRCW